MTEEMQTEIKKLIQKGMNISRDKYGDGGYPEDFDEGFKAGAKFILELPELREVVETLEWYATKGEGPYTDSGIWRRAVYALEKLKALGIVKEGEK